MESKTKLSLNFAEKLKKKEEILNYKKSYNELIYEILEGVDS